MLEGADGTARGDLINWTVIADHRNSLCRAIEPSADDRQVARLAKLLVPLVALFLALKGGEIIVALLLMG